MNPAIKKIGKDFVYSYQSKRANQELAIDITNFIKESIPFLQEEALSSLKITQDDISAQHFISDYLSNLTQLTFHIKSCIKELFNQQIIEDIIFSELSFIYKNLQMIYAKAHNLSTDFVVNSECCDICKFLVNYPNHLEYHFQHDDCDSYLQLHQEFPPTSNIISQKYKIKNVPASYKNSIESCLRLSIMKYPMLIKPSLFLIYFQSPQEYDKPDDIFSFKQDNTIYQKFNIYSYKEDLLRHLVIVNENELTKKIYYSKLKTRESSPASHFISFLAEQNSHSYLRESLVAYILNKDILKIKDEEIYCFLEERLN